MNERLLYVSASPRGEGSMSGRLAEVLLERYRQLHPTVTVERLDLWANRLPEFGPAAVEAKMAAISGATPDEGAWAPVRAEAERVLAADRLVLATPVWNGSVPWTLKHWIDTVTQPGLLFGFDPDTGYRGLATDRRAAVVYASSVYGDGLSEAFGRDFHRAYLEDWLRFIGVEVAASVPLWRTGAPDGLEQRQALALDAARRAAEAL